MTTRLTQAQERFFASYIEEFQVDGTLPDTFEGMSSDEIARLRSEFIARDPSDFDGAATAAEMRVAKNLKEMGYLSEVDPHTSVVSTRPDNLYVVFSSKGMEALFDVAVKTLQHAPAPKVSPGR